MNCILIRVDFPIHLKKNFHVHVKVHVGLNCMTVWFRILSLAKTGETKVDIYRVLINIKLMMPILFKIWSYKLYGSLDNAFRMK